MAFPADWSWERTAQLDLPFLAAPKQCGESRALPVFLLVSRKLHEVCFRPLESSLGLLRSAKGLLGQVLLQSELHAGVLVLHVDHVLVRVCAHTSHNAQVMSHGLNLQILQFSLTRLH